MSIHMYIIAITTWSWSVLRVIVLVELCIWRLPKLHVPYTLKTDWSYIYLYDCINIQIRNHPPYPHESDCNSIDIRRKSQSTELNTLTHLDFFTFPIQNQMTLHFIKRLSKIQICICMSSLKQEGELFIYIQKPKHTGKRKQKQGNIKQKTCFLICYSYKHCRLNSEVYTFQLINKTQNILKGLYIVSSQHCALCVSMNFMTKSQ